MSGYLIPRRRWRRRGWKRFLPRLETAPVPRMHQPAARRPSLLARLWSWLDRELIQP